MALVSYEQALAHLKHVGDAEVIESDVRLKIDHATALVLNYLKRPDHGWTEFTDPSIDTEFAIVQAAILTVLGDLYLYRGDDEPDDARLEPEMANYLKPNVRRMLYSLRDPALA